tara:strand:+ start:493 stop:849 length:357 start_codon:yes stop_codon:yes gene_type:complete
MITVILDNNNIVTTISESPYKPILNLEEGQSSLEVESSPELGLEYDPSTKTFIKSNRVKFKEIRNKRDELLSAADYTQLSDSTYPSTQDAWKTYRQQLRDITKGVTDPDTIVFPEEPK